MWQGAGGRIPQEGSLLDQGGPSKPGREAVPEDSACLRGALPHITVGPMRSREGEADGAGPTGRGKRGCGPSLRRRREEGRPPTSGLEGPRFCP